MKKFIKPIVSAAMAVSVAASCIMTASALTPKDGAAVTASSDISFSGSAQILGDAVITGGKLTAGNGIKSVTGTVYAANSAAVDMSLVTEDKRLDVAEYTGSESGNAMPSVTAAPDAEWFASSKSGYTDGSKSVTADWKNPEIVISDNAYINELSVSEPYGCTIDTSEKKAVVLRVNTLNVASRLKVVGDGKAVIYVSKLQNSANGKLNPDGDASKLNIVFLGENAGFKDFYQVNANAVAANAASFDIKARYFDGTVYTAGNLSLQENTEANGYFFAPESDTAMNGSSIIKGRLVTKSLLMSGNTKIQLAGVSDKFDSDISDIIFDNASAPDAPSDESAVNVKAVVPRKMSIRLSDGRVFKNGDSFEMIIGREYKFCMCSNNWENDTYDDNGNGLAGTVVYKAIVSKSAKTNSFDAESHTFTISTSDKTLRTDTNKSFMAYRFYFKNGNYNKQTGIDTVVNTPLESLSVNLPLGSTVKCDAYQSYEMIDTSNVFIETAEDKTVCYKDFYWQH